MVIDGELCEDRSKRKEDMTRVARAKYSKSDRLAMNLATLEQLRVQADVARACSTHTSSPITMHVLCRALSRLREGKAVGADGISARMLPSLSWDALRVVVDCFQRRFWRLAEAPASWKFIRASIMLKNGKGQKFDESRTLAVNSVVNT
eukprot:6437081-Pyramimonas_sp.AAC.1